MFYFDRKKIFILLLSLKAFPFSPLVEECLNKLPENHEKRVSQYHTFSCNNSPQYALYNSYKMAKKDHQLILSMNICIKLTSQNIPNFKQTALALLKREQEECINPFYQKHNIILDITFDSSPHPKHCDQTLTLHDETNTPNALNWPVFQDNRTNPPTHYDHLSSLRCAVYIHEIAHFFGVPDNYPYAGCPPLKDKKDDDIMTVTSYEPLDQKFYPYAIKTILQPLCPGIK